VLRNIFESRSDEVTGDWRRWRMEEINELYFLATVLLENISRRTTCVGMWHEWGRGIF